MTRHRGDSEWKSASEGEIEIEVREEEKTGQEPEIEAHRADSAKGGGNTAEAPKALHCNSSCYANCSRSESRHQAKTEVEWRRVKSSGGHEPLQRPHL